MKSYKAIKIVLIVLISFSSFQICFAQKKATKKVMAPIWNCSKVEILCGKKTLKNYYKKIYVESTASWSVFKNEKIVVKDVNGNVISPSPELITSTKFTSAPYNLKGGQTYTVTIIDGSGNIHRNNNGQLNSYTIVAPKCGVEKELEMKKTKINPNVLKTE